MIAPPSASWRLTSMMIGRSDASSASVKALAILVTSLGPLPPGAADLLDVVIADLTVGATRVGIDVDTEEQRMGDERFVLLPVVGRDPAGQQERLGELGGERRDDGGIERLPRAAHAAVRGHYVEQEHVDPGLLGGPEQGFLDALAAADVQDLDHAHVIRDRLDLANRSGCGVAVQLDPVGR